MVLGEGAKNVPIRPVVLQKAKDLWGIEKEQKKGKAHKFLGGFINDLLQQTLEKYEFLQIYAPYLSVLEYDDDRITLLDSNPKAKIRYIDIFVKDSKLYCDKDKATDCIHCHFVWAIPEVARLNLMKIR